MTEVYVYQKNGKNVTVKLDPGASLEVARQQAQLGNVVVDGKWGPKTHKAAVDKANDPAADVPKLAAMLKAVEDSDLMAQYRPKTGYWKKTNAQAEQAANNITKQASVPAAVPAAGKPAEQSIPADDMRTDGGQTSPAAVPAVGKPAEQSIPADDMRTDGGQTSPAAVPAVGKPAEQSIPADDMRTDGGQTSPAAVPAAGKPAEQSIPADDMRVSEAPKRPDNLPAVSEQSAHAY